MTLETMQTEFLDIWNSNKARFFGDATWFDLDKYLTESFTTASSSVNELIPNHLFLLSQATSCLFLFIEFVGERKMKARSAAFLSQLHRSVNCLIAIRLLLTNGFEETCRPITRNYVESLDISLACLVDPKFAVQFFGDDHIDFDLLWKKSIGYGKVYQYLRVAGKLAGIPDEKTEEIIENRKALKNLFSSSVHCDASGAIRSILPPVLGYPDMFSKKPHGAISIHTANHIASVIDVTFEYFVLILKILFSENVPPEFDLPSEGKNRHSFLAHFLAFQEVYLRHELPDGEEIISPDFSSVHD